MTCENCGHEYDPIRHRWLCPACRWKASCCEGAPAPVSPSITTGVFVERYWPLDYSDCVRCDEPICRFPGGAWEHLDSRDDWDHDPEPDIESLTERQAEEELQPWRGEAIARRTPVTLMEAGAEGARAYGTENVDVKGGVL